MVVIDDYSRFPVVETLTSISAKSVIPRLDRIFAMFGIPSICRSNNGPPFNGEEFRQFSIQLGFRHRRITPLRPQANSHVERFISPLQKAIKTSVIEGKNYKQEINTFLRNYRACPHPSTGISPAEIMFNRPMNTLLPQFSVKRPDKRIRQRDAKVKLKRKLYSDKKFGAKQSKSKPGDSVLVKQPKKNKLTPPFNPNPGIITQKKGSMVTVRHGNRTLTRDASHFKPISMKHAHQDPPKRNDTKISEPRVSPHRKRKKPARFKDFVCT